MITTKIHNTIQSYLNSKVRRMRGLAGDGLFAARAIKKDELVCMWGGTIYTGEQFEEQPEAMKHYGLQVGENLYIAPANLDSVDDAEYFNHSCEPNCGFRGQAALVAMRDIKADAVLVVIAWLLGLVVGTDGGMEGIPVVAARADRPHIGEAGEQGDRHLYGHGDSFRLVGLADEGKCTGYSLKG